MNEKKFYMIDLKIKRYAWSTRSQYDSKLIVNARNEDDVTLENVFCDEATKNIMLETIKRKLDELDWLNK